MALITCRIFSESLRCATSVEVIVPQPASEMQIGMASGSARASHPVLYLLHGLSDDETIWARRTSIERYASAKSLAVVMPRVDRSFYCDMVYGPAYWTYISEELPRLCAGFFPISPRREDTFACGFSMGGYGAFKLALRKPERFAAAASISGVMDLEARVGKNGIGVIGPEEKTALFGPGMRVADTDNDLFHLARACGDSPGPKPRLLQLCGSDDVLHGENRKFRAFMPATGLDWSYEESPGEHNWDFVDLAIQRVLEWLPL